MDTTNKKLNVISRTVSISERLLALMNEAKELRQEALDSGFGPGGADVIDDADFDVSEETKHLSTARFLDAFTVFAALDVTLAANARQHYIRLQLLKR